MFMYGCETWILTEALIEKLDIFARTCHRIMLGIKQSRYRVVNKSLYQLIKFKCACLQTSPLTALSSMNPIKGYPIKATGGLCL